MNINTPLLDAYRNSYFFINKEIGLIDFAVITAWNPFGKLMSNSVNQRANYDLECDILKQNYEKLLVGDINREWTEESFAVEMPLVEAVELGKKYNQNAIYYVRNDRLFLVSCVDNNADESEIAQFSQRVK
ncbi:DUF3293 domain-containing protein [Vibrio hannami]|uniref:DUF3293 domain-containing protein n=1 Tax=Vibrio hannami TaxID=2717094 RepID=UPI00241038EC|nr:DUF3293 domain-containing protein [Vibrio hannami]MDG3088998.1 DUF3293 domain-containing protein [Vibrio hannami]